MIFFLIKNYRSFFNKYAIKNNMRGYSVSFKYFFFSTFVHLLLSVIVYILYVILGNRFSKEIYFIILCISMK